MDHYKKEKIIIKHLLNPHIVLALVVGALFLAIGPSDAVALTDSSICPLINVDPCEKTGLFKDSCISIDQLRQKQINVERVVVLDARSRKSYTQAHIKGSLLSLTSDYYEKEELFKRGVTYVRQDMDASLAENLKKYPKDTPIVVYCDVGCQTSSAVVLQIKRLGFADVKVLEDGFQVWQEKGYPVSQGAL